MDDLGEGAADVGRALGAVGLGLLEGPGEAVGELAGLPGVLVGAVEPGARGEEEGVEDGEDLVVEGGEGGELRGRGVGRGACVDELVLGVADLVEDEAGDGADAREVVVGDERAGAVGGVGGAVVPRAALEAARAVEVVGLPGAGDAGRGAERAADGAPDGVGRANFNLKKRAGRQGWGAGRVRAFFVVEARADESAYEGDEEVVDDQEEEEHGDEDDHALRACESHAEIVMGLVECGHATGTVGAHFIDKKSYHTRDPRRR